MQNRKDVIKTLWVPSIIYNYTAFFFRKLKTVSEKIRLGSEVVKNEILIEANVTKFLLVSSASC